MKYYVVQAIKHNMAVTTTFGQGNLKLSWADGMIGCLPVFANKKLAKKYAGKDCEVMTFEDKI